MCDQAAMATRIEALETERDVLLAELAFARPLIDAIAEWETKNGSIACIMPDEREVICALLMQASIKGSARASRSCRKTVDEPEDLSYPKPISNESGR